MQAISPITLAEILSSSREPKLRFEVWHDGAWVDLCTLGGRSRVESISLTTGGASVSREPVAGSWAATIDNADRNFYPENPDALYADYLTTGKWVRISTGGIYGGLEMYWVRMIGVMDSPRHEYTPPRVQLKGLDLTAYLVNHELSMPGNYWGDIVTLSTVAPVVTLGAELYKEGDACEIGAGEANNVTNWTATISALSSVADAGGGSTYALKTVFGTGTVVKTYLTPGTFIWRCPPGVTSVKVECWGGGGGGGRGGLTSGAGGDGGGGGAYSRSTNVAVTPGEDYTVEVGPGGNSDTSGGDTWFKNMVTVLAKGGQNGQHHDGSFAAGKGGQASAGVGDIKYNGGNGAGNALNAGGGGGSSAGTGANGTAGSTPTVPEVGGAGGTAPTGGGNGGKGGNLDSNGNGGTAPGGGGGGAGRGSSVVKKGGKGGAGKLVLTYTGAADVDAVVNTNVGAASAAQLYKIALKYRRVTGPGVLAVRAYLGATRQEGEISGLASESWATAEFFFRASTADNVALHLDITEAATGTEFRVDQISIKPVTNIAYTRRYALPTGCTGIYLATLDGAAIWYGEDPNGYYYDAEHNEIVLHPNCEVRGGTDNLVVYYHTAQLPEHVIADLLVRAKLYGQRADALAAMAYDETGIAIDRVYFEAGRKALAAVGDVCERCNFRFYFGPLGMANFRAPRAIKAVGEEDADLAAGGYAQPQPLEDSAEQYNAVSITGERIAQPLGTDPTMDSNYKGVAVDEALIEQQGEKTLSINNRLYQSDAACSEKAAEILAERKLKQRYVVFELPNCALPLEIGDTVRLEIPIAIEVEK